MYMNQAITYKGQELLEHATRHTDEYAVLTVRNQNYFYKYKDLQLTRSVYVYKSS